MLKNVPVLIEGARLRLRRSTPADAQATFDAARDPDVMRYMDWPAHRSVQDASDYLAACAQRWHDGSEYHWVIERKPDAGTIGAVSCRVKGHAADFGYLLAHAHWGHGYATEAAGLVVGWLRRQPTVLRIWATTDADNRRSAAVLGKVGLQREGVMRKATLRPNIGGGPRDTLLYASVKDSP